MSVRPQHLRLLEAWSHLRTGTLADTWQVAALKARGQPQAPGAGGGPGPHPQGRVPGLSRDKSSAVRSRSDVLYARENRPWVGRTQGLATVEPRPRGRRAEGKSHRSRQRHCGRGLAGRELGVSWGARALFPRARVPSWAAVSS